MAGQTSLSIHVTVPTPLLLIPSPWAVAVMCGECFGYSARQQIVGNRRKRNFSFGELPGKLIPQGKVALGKTINAQRTAESILNLLRGPA